MLILSVREPAFFTWHSLPSDLFKNLFASQLSRIETEQTGHVAQTEKSTPPVKYVYSASANYNKHFLGQPENAAVFTVMLHENLVKT